MTRAVMLVGWQWLLLAVLATGWGALLVRAAPAPGRWFTWLYASIGGGVPPSSCKTLLPDVKVSGAQGCWPWPSRD